MSGQHHRGTPLIQLLARLGWQRCTDIWTVPCQDVDGRRAQLLIRLSPTGMTITPTAPGLLRLTALQVGRLRGAAREAIHIGGPRTDPNPAEPARWYWHTEAPTAPDGDLPVQRGLVHVDALRDRRSTPSA
ncbi:MAG: hypothetical protein ACRDTA_12585 [Pseudonocardiaceae bacterium]